MSLVKPPHPDPGLDPFRDGLGVLLRDAEVAGHVATTVGESWSPFSPLRRNWWVWLVVVWADGIRERPTEDYPPWTYVSEMKQGHFDWFDRGPRDESFLFRWLGPDEALAERTRLGITSESF